MPKKVNLKTKSVNDDSSDQKEDQNLKYICPRCGYTKDKKSAIEKHLERKSKCQSKLLDIPVSEYVDELMTEEVLEIEGYPVCIIKTVFEALTKKREEEEDIIDADYNSDDEDDEDVIDADYVSKSSEHDEDEDESEEEISDFRKQRKKRLLERREQIQKAAKREAIEDKVKEELTKEDERDREDGFEIDMTTFIRYLYRRVDILEQEHISVCLFNHVI